MTTAAKFKGGPVLTEMEQPRYFSDYVRYVRDSVNKRTEKQVNPYKQNDGWYVESAEPGLNLKDDFIGLFNLAASTLLIGEIPWLYTVTATGTALPSALEGGGVTFSSAAENDDVLFEPAGATFPLALQLEPHLHFKVILNHLHTDFLLEIGFEDTAGTTQLLLAYEATDWVLNCDDGTGTDTTTSLGLTPDTTVHDVEFRFGDDGTNGPGSQCEILFDGEVVGTFTLAATLKYPDLDTAVNFIIRQTNGKTGGGAYTVDVQDFRLCAIR